MIHADGFDVVASEPIARIGVDAGMAGVYDHECPVPAQSQLVIEGVVHGLGVFARSGHGDGVYPVFAGKVDGRVTKLRLAFLDDERPAVDETVYSRPSRRYAVSATFAVGDTIEHPKFGAGAIVSAQVNGGDVEYVVNFETAGTRRLLQSYAKLVPA